MMFPPNGAAYSICETAFWRCETDEQRAAGLEAVQFALRPAPEGDIGAALYTLRMMTRGRDAGNEADRQAEAIIWLQHLSTYPADIVLTTLRNWPKRPDGQWWPTWHEVQKEIEAQTSGRRLLAEHIRSSGCLPAPRSDELPHPDDKEAWDRRTAQAEAARKRFDIRSTKGETVVDREAVPAAKLAQLDKAVDVAGEKLATGSYRLSPAALATFTKDHLDTIAVDDPGTSYEAYAERERNAA